MHLEELSGEQAKEVVHNMRRWLMAGATIRAMDPDAVLVPQANGTVYGGLLVEMEVLGFPGDGETETESFVE